MKDLIEPTPSDRETAAKLVVMAELRELIRDGRLDDGPMVQAVAAHAKRARLEGIRLGLEAARKVVAARQVVYHGKAERHSILDADTLTRHDMFTHTAEAMDWLSDELAKLDPTTIAGDNNASTV